MVVLDLEISRRGDLLRTDVHEALFLTVSPFDFKSLFSSTHKGLPTTK